MVYKLYLNKTIFKKCLLLKYYALEIVTSFENRDTQIVSGTPAR